MNKSELIVSEIRKHLTECQFITTPAYDIYEGTSGLQNLDVLGFRVKHNILEVWRNLLSQLQIYEVETPILTSHNVLKSSGHIDRFYDFVVYDKDGKCYRADHIVKEYLKKQKENTTIVDNMTKEQLESFINDNKVIHKIQKNKVDKVDKNEDYKVVTKNLMFKTEELYLRPELAQGIFVNFKKYYNFLKKLPFGIAQTGKSFRYEISPKPFLRLREFTQAEIEYFFDPQNPSHILYNIVKECELTLLPSNLQLNKKSAEIYKLGDAVDEHIVCNQIMAVMLFKVYEFAIKIGLNKKKMRFRQHLPTEMAHYSKECWDLECLIEDDWIECVGIAHRGEHDLKSHSVNQNLTVSRYTNNGETVIKKTIICPDKKVIAKKYTSETNLVSNYIANLLDQKEKEQFIMMKKTKKTDDEPLELNINNKKYIINSEMYKLEEVPDDFYPHVIEPSFGIDRLLFAIFNQNFWKRENDVDRCVLSLSPHISPYSVAIYQLSNDDNILKMVAEIYQRLTEKGIKCYTDTSGSSIGKRYVRSDKLGIPFVITVDFDSLEDKAVTIRERDSMKQVRKNIELVISTSNDFSLYF